MTAAAVRVSPVPVAISTGIPWMNGQSGRREAGKPPLRAFYNGKIAWKASAILPTDR